MPLVSTDCGVCRRANVRHQQSTLLGTEAGRSASVRIGDLDGDKDLDVVVANGRHWPQQNLIFFNPGRAKFNLARPLGQDLSTSYATELADLDGDGDLDIVVGNDTAPNAVFLNDGHGQFLHHGTFGQPASIRSLTLADIDRDGDIDVLANARGQQNLIYLNDGLANFSSSRPFGDADDSTIDVAVADVNGDGHPDLVHEDIGNVHVQLNDGQGRFEPGVRYGTGDVPLSAAVADFDGDGRLDIVTANNSGHNVTLLRNLGCPTCYADCDKSSGNGVLDLFDFLCFQGSFVSGEPYACDCDTTTGPLVCDLFDFLCFQGAFVGGCP